MPIDEPACPLCAGRRTRRAFEKDGIDYWSCRQCGFRFSTPDRNANLTNALEDYEDAYLQYLESDPGDAANFASLWTWMAGHARLESSRVLDVGAGSGKLVRYLRGRGVDAHGIEPSRALFDRFLRGDEAFSCETIDAVAARSATFPIVTAYDVIEHVPDPVPFLRAIAAVLEPGGVLFLSTPDVESLTARAFGRRWHFYYRYHLSYFGPRTLTRAASPHGLRVIACSHRRRWRSIGYVVRYAAEFVAGGRAPGGARAFDGWLLPFNFFDTMSVVLRRDAGVGSAAL